MGKIVEKKIKVITLIEGKCVEKEITYLTLEKEE